jgi:Fe-S-cluster-containing hydrogenase component 2
MALKIILDMIKIRDAMIENPSMTLPEACFYPGLNVNGLKTIRELAAFRYSCRKCTDAPCISVCPAEALEKDGEGLIERHTNLCVSCRSCVAICPFGTMMTDFFVHHRNRDILYNIADDRELEEFIKACPEGTVSVTDMDEAPEKNIFRLNEKVLIKDFVYTAEQQ